MADLVLLLVSKDFIESDYIFGNELTVAMQRHRAGFATVVPIIVRAIDIDAEDREALPFLSLQGLPTDMRPVTSWPNRDEAWTNVAKGLRATVKVDPREESGVGIAVSAPRRGRLPQAAAVRAAAGRHGARSRPRGARRQLHRAGHRGEPAARRRAGRRRDAAWPGASA